MNNLFSTLGSIGLLCQVISNASGADVLQPDSEGYIRDWVMLAPITLPEGESGAHAIFKEQIRGEFTLTVWTFTCSANRAL